MASATARSISNTVSNTVSNNGPFSGTSTLQNVHNAVIGLPITREYGFVILSAAAIALQIPLQGISVGIIRGKLFDKAFFRTHFNMTDDEIPAAQLQETPMTEIHYQIVQHDGGWAYKVGDVFSETFRSHDDALAAARDASSRQELAGETQGIVYQDGSGEWHEEIAKGDDRPHADVVDRS